MAEGLDFFGYTKALTDFWAAGGRAMLSAQENMAAADGVTRAAKTFAELWAAAQSLAGTLAAKLPEGAAKGTSLDPTVEAAFRKMLDPSAWIAGTSEMDAVFTRMADGPRFADVWDVERRHAVVMQAWAVLRRCSLEHGVVSIEAWLRAGRRFTEASGQLADKQDGKALLDLWTDIANSELIATQRSDDFLRTQAAMIRAGTALKQAQSGLAEYYGDQLGLPTRTELDDVHRSVTELRRELRMLQRRLRDAEPAPAPHAAPAPKPARVRKRS